MIYIFNPFDVAIRYFVPTIADVKRRMAIIAYDVGLIVRLAGLRRLGLIIGSGKTLQFVVFDMLKATVVNDLIRAAILSVLVRVAFRSICPPPGTR